MTSSLSLILLYFVLVSLITIGMFAWDKHKARAGRWRTPETTLLLFCALGGSIGGGVAMLLFRHKVSKRSFLSRYYLILTLQVIAAGGWMAYSLHQREAREQMRRGIVVEVEPL